MRPRDTSPEAWKVLMDLMRTIPPEEKLRRAIEFTAIVRNLGEATIRAEHPSATPREIFLRIAQRQLGEDFQKVFGEEWRQYGCSQRDA
ncbi:MAG: hypothetical protein JWP63_6351 [Candidatus Solibacter sp.]|nr:hypothetical protein [Candidatus Solibacter sp.]